MLRIDFNCDLGEDCGDDAAIMPWITTANIACGAHAGDEISIRDTLRRCREHGVVVGAHPGYADREHFGRREIELAPMALRAMLVDQLRFIAAIAADEGVPLRHVKPHGALYNRSARDAVVAAIVAETVHEFDPALTLIGLSGSQSIRAAEAAGLRIAHEVFAERGYAADGTLLPRGSPGAVIETLDEAIAQARELARHRRVHTAGGPLSVRADTLCLHGDRADAASFARALREALEADGILIAPLGTLA
jgi:5-oxoprolinase (ATP-hydrolysing) subunit A